MRMLPCTECKQFECECIRNWDEEPTKIIVDPLTAIVVKDGYGESRSHTIEEWHKILLLDQFTLVSFYGLDHIDLLYELENTGLWHA